MFNNVQPTANRPFIVRDANKFILNAIRCDGMIILVTRQQLLRPKTQSNSLSLATSLLYIEYRISLLYINYSFLFFISSFYIFCLFLFFCLLYLYYSFIEATTTTTTTTTDQTSAQITESTILPPPKATDQIIHDLMSAVLGLLQTIRLQIKQ